MTSWEKQEEREIARLFGRPEREFILDFPYYHDVPITPKVNFALRFKDQ